MEKYLQRVVGELILIPRGARINNPYVLVPLCMTLSFEAQIICRTQQKEVYFTRLSLKHLLEKGKEGQRIIKLLPALMDPDEIYEGSNSNRFLLVRRMMRIKRGRPHLIAFEITAKKEILS